MANISAIRKQAAPITYHLLVAQEPYNKTKKPNSQRNLLRIFRKSQDNGPLAKTKTNKRIQDRKSKRARQKRKNKIEIGKGNQITVLRFQTGKASRLANRGLSVKYRRRVHWSDCYKRTMPHRVFPSTVQTVVGTR